jgi:hypothetical protein
VSLSDADVAALAREAVDRRSLDLDIRIVPADPVDPYRWGTPAWMVSAGGASSYITADMTAAAALAKLQAVFQRCAGSGNGRAPLPGRGQACQGVSRYLDVVGRGRAPWQDRRRAGNRLNGWHNENPNAVPGHPDDGDEALQALADIHLVRGLLDRAELVA